MNRQDIVDFLTELQGIRPKVQVVNGWVSTACPLAPFTHTKSHDRHPSFGVSIHEDGRPSIFNCFTCGKKGKLQYLAKLMGEFSGEDFSALIEEADTTELLGANVPEWGHHTPQQDKLPNPIGEEYWDIYDPAPGHPYLRQRRIDDSTARELRLKVDPDDHGVERILFPVCERGSGLQGFTGRATTDATPKVRDYFGLKKKLCLLGIEHLRADEPVIVVEGLFAFARLFEFDCNVVATMGATLHPGQAKQLRRIGQPVICLYDYDEAGLKGRDSFRKLLSKHIPVLKVKYPRGKTDPDDLTAVELRRMLDSPRLL